MPGSPLFTPQAIAALRQAQTDSMPHVCYVLTPSITREPGAVARQSWTVTRSFACRLSRQTTEERVDDSARRQGAASMTLSYPYSEAPLAGDETVIVVGDEQFGETAFSLVLRVSTSSIPKSFETRRAATVTTLDAPAIDPAAYVP